MAIDGYYYLHDNGELIYRRELGGTAADLRDSDLVRGFWPCDPTDRESAWTILVEALAAGARPERIRELATKWHCTNEDAAVYGDRVGCVVRLDHESRPNDWVATRRDFVNLAESPSGWGNTALEAMADLAKAMGYRPSKMWGATFKNLLERPVSAKGGA